MAWTTACPDWAERLRARKSIIPPPIFPDQAGYALGIFKQLKVVDLPKVYDSETDEWRPPTFGECSEDWVFDFVRAIFGGYDADTGKQLIREYGLLISKKNTKSTIAAGIMLTALIICWRQEEEHLILAPTKEVADNSFKPAAAMVRADDELMDMFHIQDHIRTITHRETRNSLKVVAADTDTVSGKKAGRILVDELWLFGKRANAVAMFMEALGGQVSRDEGWVIYLTTQSDDPPAGVFKEKLLYWRDVRDGKVHDPKTLGILYEFPEEMIESKAYLDRANFYITNPNLGRSVSAEWIEDQVKLLRARTDGAFQQFLAKHLNIEIGLNLRSDRWAGADHWMTRGHRALTLSSLLERSEVVTAGIDGGGLDDLLGLAFIGRERGTGNWLHWGRAWAHPSVLERRKEIEPRLRDFERAGELVIVQRIGDDAAELADLIRNVYDAGLFPEKNAIGADQNGVTFNDALIDANIPEDLIIGVSQGWKLGGIIKTVERKLAEGTFQHGGQALMAWSVGNARIELRANGILITKQASGTAKIDPLMALFDAAQLMALNPAAGVKKIQQGFVVM
ncbi:terminase large subunit [Bordetella bronchiseptica]|uniref:terminase large subunit n=1 Tax=Bordetella bronchiseptica TaxID=518 RepID=UPI00045B76A9|nr:terminase TerL endonuclease subunit [Bordetella bronchiseptica]KAK50475.1 putative phage terminase, large subunit [Bordetella bronchiseptica OSU054]